MRGKERDAAVPEVSFLSRPDRHRIAYARTPGRLPGVVFLPGFRSDMEGGKALALEAHCSEAGRQFVRFDWSGCGRSAGRFEDGTIGGWRDDALAVLDALTDGPQLLVGSSMGGWIALLVALARPGRVAGIVGVAAAPDFTAEIEASLGDGARRDLAECGVWLEPSPYAEEPTPITRRLLDEARDHLLLPRAPVPVRVPVRLLQGMRDSDVPWRHALRLSDALAGEDVVTLLVKDGDHRLSRPADIARLVAVVESLCRQLESA
jgi:pimeloyl-ACP methyl ester carboxylesterase